MEVHVSYHFNQKIHIHLLHGALKYMERRKQFGFERFLILKAFYSIMGRGTFNEIE